ncbi:uncharacterized protein MONOS_8179 [Monocercomonoides exilis]|uniref:uncharacterized protein n=1 Tax=Monocercomonoides exilis TaxID=2049356 RepID=UPI0035594DCA|nr:hypothetical protein MONOS_8179 [Monocercomonoides exilis]|eukprot:MONOS_8179.1-p1 / transcript=MONOS_8179.1 / gene=MONOS_8179 / organism=Monocercomonoides_exilis_PA203 / gene_product=unspecified product / transcript_product=unspecified product / location=Mono_scaffold00300:67938-68712(-) / protein_length=203 / sequence_SO=supercontig / SO=protein_coding / is_pseudo=false
MSNACLCSSIDRLISRCEEEEHLCDEWDKGIGGGTSSREVVDLNRQGHEWKKRFCDEVCEDGENVPRRSGGASAAEKERGADRADEREEEEVVETTADEVTAAGKSDEERRAEKEEEARDVGEVREAKKEEAEKDKDGREEDDDDDEEDDVAIDAVEDPPSTIVGANSDAETEGDVSSKKERSVANSKVGENGAFEVLISER